MAAWQKNVYGRAGRRHVLFVFCHDKIFPHKMCSLFVTVAQCLKTMREPWLGSRKVRGILHLLWEGRRSQYKQRTRRESKQRTRNENKKQTRRDKKQWAKRENKQWTRRENGPQRRSQTYKEAMSWLVVFWPFIDLIKLMFVRCNLTYYFEKVKG